MHPVLLKITWIFWKPLECSRINWNFLQCSKLSRIFSFFRTRETGYLRVKWNLWEPNFSWIGAKSIILARSDGISFASLQSFSHNEFKLTIRFCQAMFLGFIINFQIIECSAFESRKGRDGEERALITVKKAMPENNSIDLSASWFIVFSFRNDSSKIGGSREKRKRTTWTEIR